MSVDEEIKAWSKMKSQDCRRIISFYCSEKKKKNNLVNPLWAKLIVSCHLFLKNDRKLDKLLISKYLLSCLVKFLSHGNNDHNSAGYHLESSKIFNKDCMVVVPWPSIGTLKKLWVFNCLGRPGRFWQYWRFLKFC